MLRRLPLAAAALLLFGCSRFAVRAAPDTMKPPPPIRANDTLQPVETVDEKRSEAGPVLIIERLGQATFQGAFILVDDPKDWEYARGLVQGIYDGGGGGPSVQTVDDFILGQRARLKADATAPRLDLEKIRREILSDLKGHRAVVYRFVPSPSQ